MLKRTPSLTEQTKSYLKQRILNNQFEAGRIPSETELAGALGVSRTTIRDALSRLELEGVIFRKQGAGTFVNEAGLQIRTRLEEIWSYEAMLQAHDYTTTTKILRVAETALSLEKGFGLGDRFLAIRKLFLADNLPVILTVNYIPTQLIQSGYTEQDFHPPIYEFLAAFCQQHLSYYLSEIVPLNTPAWLSDILQIPTDKAMVSFEETGYNQENEPILRTYSYFKDDLLRLRLIRREAQ
jgi:GntR family transcriptional regulator